MSQHGSGDTDRTEGRMFDNLSMNEIAPSITQEPSEVGKRIGWQWLIAVVVLVAVAALGFGMRQMLNVAPGTDAQQHLQTELAATDAWHSGMVLGARYTAGDRLRVDFSLTAGSDSTALRKATIEVMKILIQERPNRDLYIDGFQGEKQVVSAEYRQKGKLAVAGGGLEPNIAVKVVGEPGGGIGSLVKPEGGGPRGE
jgi:hypothetical protein